ncbi:restriction endonuclease [Leptospira mtsangambouensis]|uniref:restriction endonuclease n=1 Tax=Leptospira mtsangambouensis TaxID=2484912 RepID=UPI001EECE952|nr:restriction endonuclease [Leptospira mtsangambouensis]MCG6142802.1 restriction endonuclease [Leptospira mtsangambouensis]
MKPILDFLRMLIENNDVNDDLEIGHEFEQYVAELFTSQGNYFSIIEWTPDNSKKHKNFRVESNQNPDLVIQYNPTKEKFAVECKFRSGLYKNRTAPNGAVLKWSYPEQIKRYKQFSIERKIPVFVVIGLGGEPDDPEYMFCIPLEEAKYPELFTSLLEKYERPSDKEFFWRNKKLT